MNEDKLKAFVIIGPTSSGKSALAVALAKKFNGEVISADSRQVYKGLDIGTGKITPEEMKGVPHHLLDVVSPRTVFSAGKFKKLADKAMEEIVARKKLPIICGGTAFYVELITTNTSLPHASRNNAFRTTLEKKDTEELFAMLETLDSIRSKAIDRHNKVRLIRAIEIASALGSVPRASTKESLYEFLKIGLAPSYETLQENIRARLKTRIKNGMLEETVQLHQSGVSWKRLSELGIEYRYLSLFLQKKVSLEEALRLIELKSFQYAKSQMKWWKKDKTILWFEDGKKNKKEIDMAAMHFSNSV